MKMSARAVQGGDWIKTAYKLSVYLRGQAILITTMQAKCPRKTNRWLHLGRLLDFLVHKRMAIVEHLDEKQPMGAPDNLWSTITISIRPVISMINVTWTILQRHEIVLEEQREALVMLVSRLIQMLDAKRLADDSSCHILARSDFVEHGGFWALLSEGRLFLDAQGSVVQMLFSTLSNDNQNIALVVVCPHFCMN